MNVHPNRNLKCVCGHTGNGHINHVGNCAYSPNCNCKKFVVDIPDKKYLPQDREVCKFCFHPKHRHRAHFNECYDCDCKVFLRSEPVHLEIPIDHPKIDHPDHYGGDTVYEAIKVIMAWKLGFNLGNALKYICRAGKKDNETALHDLRKAKFYIEYEIAEITKDIPGKIKT